MKIYNYGDDVPRLGILYGNWIHINPPQTSSAAAFPIKDAAPDSIESLLLHKDIPASRNVSTSLGYGIQMPGKRWVTFDTKREAVAFAKECEDWDNFFATLCPTCLGSWVEPNNDCSLHIEPAIL